MATHPNFLLFFPPEGKEFPLEVAEKAFFGYLESRGLTFSDVEWALNDLPDGVDMSDTEWYRAEDAAWEAVRAVGFDDDLFTLEANRSIQPYSTYEVA